ncbi:DNA topoisomerase IV [Flavobacterium magnum]|uniref:DNA topoisomerase IV n=1 Tax=Flavobacterium magnum TaxID=2162713 RepID=A0A2S0RFE4_9FLAO|nr:DNA topoisomerase IV [Flavobacterium magnum]AWA30483.1 DNA topoisomerase IV [Flavobacterium magnum]
MKKILLTAVSLAMISCYEPPERRCNDFKTGKFRTEQIVNGKKTVTEFERNDSLETGILNGEKETATVRWVNDCEYIMRKKDPKNYREAVAISVKILTTSKNSYTFEYGEVGKSKKFTATATRIPD